mmetsp:Transcript_20370/g.47621  ORF Transcript_20370/g.47621 Transcript_20370/m.47621 type:complete len:227 (-) Transcript_20370:197-877(-)|eukprot:CAMPEP_0114558950 /NCGR_PEP_ID=MMETSP0114-20121206/10664_1 /TAXON_ID=31324 /ORGANISM="Goniomonas sp, Strain m" /LENGTH=226 /DNA_ID=CAMNT_0001744393 /DNA_START=31 /DNA_END=711 /DNA_ORIENTATION=-
MSDDDWETAADIAIKPKGLKDNWDDEEEEDVPDPEEEERKKAAAQTQQNAQKALKAKLKAKEEAEKRAAIEAEAAAANPKRASKKVVEDADFDNAQDLFAGAGNRPAKKDLGPSAGAFDLANPTKREDFEDFANIIVKRCAEYQGSYHYPHFVRTLTRELVMALKLDDVKDVMSLVTVIQSSKIKEMKDTGKKGKKGKATAAVKVERGNARGMDDYEDDFGDDDFM